MKVKSRAKYLSYFEKVLLVTCPWAFHATGSSLSFEVWFSSTMTSFRLSIIRKLHTIHDKAIFRAENSRKLEKVFKKKQQKKLMEIIQKKKKLEHLNK